MPSSRIGESLKSDALCTESSDHLQLASVETASLHSKSERRIKSHLHICCSTAITIDNGQPWSINDYAKQWRTSGGLILMWFYHDPVRH